MAMLAEPRRKKRSMNLRGKNHWSNDPDKFGSKLMQKMGWTPGKGLGANEDGAVDNVKVRFKDDNGGVGFKDRNDQWTSHETSFEELLRNLHGGEVDQSKVHSESSLEEKSKSLQSRLHYKKFTRGKDITKYSTKDLANIFGKKTLNKVEEKQLPSEEIRTDVKFEDDKLISSGSMRDYFQSKLQKLGNGASTVLNNICENKPTLSEDDNCEIQFCGFASMETNDSNYFGKTSEPSNGPIKFVSFQSESKSVKEPIEVNNTSNMESKPVVKSNDVIKKRKNKISSQDEALEIVKIEDDENNPFPTDTKVADNPKKSKKGKKNADNQGSDISECNNTSEVSSQPVKNLKKAKKNKQMSNIITIEDDKLTSITPDQQSIVSCSKKTKKNRKNISQLEPEVTPEFKHDVVETIRDSSKKNKQFKKNKIYSGVITTGDRTSISINLEEEAVISISSALKKNEKRISDDTLSNYKNNIIDITENGFLEESNGVESQSSSVVVVSEDEPTSEKSKLKKLYKSMPNSQHLISGSEHVEDSKENFKHRKRKTESDDACNDTPDTQNIKSKKKKKCIDVKLETLVVNDAEDNYVESKPYKKKKKNKK